MHKNGSFGRQTVDKVLMEARFDETQVNGNNFSIIVNDQPLIAYECHNVVALPSIRSQFSRNHSSSCRSDSRGDC